MRQRKVRSKKVTSFTFEVKLAQFSENPLYMYHNKIIQREFTDYF